MENYVKRYISTTVAVENTVWCLDTLTQVPALPPDTILGESDVDNFYTNIRTVEGIGTKVRFSMLIQ